MSRIYKAQKPGIEYSKSLRMVQTAAGGPGDFIDEETGLSYVEWPEHWVAKVSIRIIAQSTNTATGKSGMAVYGDDDVAIYAEDGAMVGPASDGSTSVIPQLSNGGVFGPSFDGLQFEASLGILRWFISLGREDNPNDIVYHAIVRGILQTEGANISAT